MINSKTLGAAAGVQYQGVIDKSEGTNLPSLANGVIIGRFKRGRMDKPFKVTASNYQALLGRDPSNPSYLAVEDAFKRGVSEVSVLRVGGVDLAVTTDTSQTGCTSVASEWSNPITFEMVNKPTVTGGLVVYFGNMDVDVGNYIEIGTWTDLSGVTTVEEFFVAVNNTIYDRTPYQIGVISNDDGSVLIRVESKNIGMVQEGAERVIYAALKAPEFYVYDSTNIGNNGEAAIYLSNAFTNPVRFSVCEYKEDNNDIMM